MGDSENNELTNPPATAGEPTEAAEPTAETAAPEAAAAAPEAEAAAESIAEPIVEPQVEAPAPTNGSGPFYGTGRRKTSVARVFLRPGSGQLRVNGRPLDEFFTVPAWRKEARSPLAFLGVAEQYDAEITVKGGGPNGQAGAVRLGLARAVSLANPTLRVKLRQTGYLTRNPRMKERKKYGQKGARKRFQWTKR